MKARFLLVIALAFGGVFLAAPSQADDLVKVWENDNVGIYLPEGVSFNSVSAWYGSPDDPACGADVSAVLTSLAVGQNSFQVNANNGVFGDPCGGVYKILRITGIDANWQQPIEPSPSPAEEPVAEPTTSPLPESTQKPQVTPEPTQTPTAEPSLEPLATPSPEPSIPSSSPSLDAVDPIVPVLPPVVEPVVTPPVIIPQPQPQPIPFPAAPAPAPEPTPEPTVEPAPPIAEPAPPTAEPAPVAPQPTLQATAEPAPTVAPPLAPAPLAPPEPVKPEIKLDLRTVDPATISTVQQAVITQQAFAVLATAEQGSPAYAQALEALAVVAQADDPELPTELAALPLIGNVAGAVLDTFNAVGNIGADISPKERAKGQKIVVGTVIVGQMASVALVRKL